MRMKMMFVVGCALCLALALGNGVAFADTIPVQNASFEITNPLTFTCGAGCAYNYGPIPDWTITGTGGSFQPSSAYFNLSTINGSTVAFSSGGMISQYLGIGLTPNSTYTLSVGVGNRFDLLSTTYSIGLYAGATLLNSFSGSNASITPGTFATENVTFVTGATVAPGTLGIALSSLGNQTDFDNVMLTTSAPVSTPEASSLLLLCAGLAGLGTLTLYSKSKRADAVVA